MALQAGSMPSLFLCFRLALFRFDRYLDGHPLSEWVNGLIARIFIRYS